MTEAPAATATWPFIPIVGARAHEEVIDQILWAIRSGVFREGDRLPTIDLLAELMGVSKPVIGEAIRTLSNGGVVVARRGSTGGTIVVKEGLPPHLLRIASGWREAQLDELIDARRPVETQVALLAGKRGTESDFQQLLRSVEELDESVGADPTRRLAADHRFHYSMGRAAHSALLAYFQHEVLERLTLILLEEHGYEPDYEWIRDTHQETYEAIVSRRESKILKAMDRHLHRLESVAAEIAQAANRR